MKLEEWKWKRKALRKVGAAEKRIEKPIEKRKQLE
jgi:hypothetical protein